MKRELIWNPYAVELLQPHLKLTSEHGLLARDPAYRWIVDAASTFVELQMPKERAIKGGIIPNSRHMCLLCKPYMIYTTLTGLNIPAAFQLSASGASFGGIWQFSF